MPNLGTLFVSPQKHSSLTTITVSLAKLLLAVLLEASTTLIKVSQNKKEVKEVLKLVVVLVYSREGQIRAKIRDIVEIRSRSGRTIRPLRKYIDR